MNIKSVLSQIQEKLEKNEFRLTPQREAIVRVLFERADDHLKAEDLYLYAKELEPEIGLATVYRSLELLERLNIVHRLEYGDGHSRYELGHNSEGHYHHHLICLDCGEISEFKDDLLDKLEEQIARERDFEIIDHNLRFFGYCSKCRVKNVR